MKQLGSEKRNDHAVPVKGSGLVCSHMIRTNEQAGQPCRRSAATCNHKTISIMVCSSLASMCAQQITASALHVICTQRSPSGLHTVV
jgi:hypothetical protein